MSLLKTSMNFMTSLRLIMASLGAEHAQEGLSPSCAEDDITVCREHVKKLDSAI